MLADWPVPMSLQLDYLPFRTPDTGRVRSKSCGWADEEG